MRNHSAHTWKAALARVLVAVMVVLSVAFVPTTTIKAASAPTLTQSSRNILVGSTYDLNINSKIAKSTYKWSTSNKAIATVNSKGIVKGIKAGSADIVCTVKAPKKTYKLTCKVTVIKPAVVFRISNKATALNLGQKYDLNRILAPSSSNDKTTWTSSDTTIAAPDKNGKFTALKEGTVTITAKTISGKTDSVTIKVVDQAGTVTTQTELDALLGSGVQLITIKTAETVDLTIKNGDYSKTALVVDAPKADVHNNGVFASIEIKQIAANSWYENAVGNLLNILATNSRIVVGSSAKVKIEVNASSAKLKVENNGVVEEIVIAKPADLDISGSSKKEVPVVVNVPNITITTSVPLNMNLTQKINLVMLAGSEASKLQAASEAVIPNITGNTTVKVLVGTGTNAKEQEVKPTPLPVNGGTGSNPGGNTGTPTYSKTFTLAKPLTEITGINVAYAGKTYTISATTLKTLVHMINNESDYINFWKGITTSHTEIYDGQTVTVAATTSVNTKTVSFSGGQLDGKSYTATLNTNGSVTIKSNTTQVEFTVSKGSDLKTLVITGDQTKLAGVTFTIVESKTYYLADSYKKLKTIDVTYGGKTYSVGSGTLDILKIFLSDEAGYLAYWKSTTNVSNEYDGQTVVVTGEAGSATKKVSFTDKALKDKSYTVTVNSDHSVTIVSDASGISFTVAKGTDEKSLTITGTPNGLIFAPSFN